MYVFFLYTNLPRNDHFKCVWLIGSSYSDGNYYTNFEANEMNKDKRTMHPI